MSIMSEAAQLSPSNASHRDAGRKHKPFLLFSMSKFPKGRLFSNPIGEKPAQLPAPFSEPLSSDLVFLCSSFPGNATGMSQDCLQAGRFNLRLRMLPRACQ